MQIHVLLGDDLIRLKAIFFYKGLILDSKQAGAELGQDQFKLNVTI